MLIHLDHPGHEHRLVKTTLPCPGFSHFYSMQQDDAAKSKCNRLQGNEWLLAPNLSMEAFALNSYIWICSSWEWKWSMFQSLMVEPHESAVIFCIPPVAIVCCGTHNYSWVHYVHKTLNINTLGYGVLCASRSWRRDLWKAGVSQHTSWFP